MKKIKRAASVFLLLVVLSSLFAALPVLSAEEVMEDDAVPLTGESITVFNWGMYIADGSEDSMDINAEFTRRTGIAVNYITFEDNESMYAKLKAGGSSYDVIIPSDYMIAKLIEEDMLLPLDFDNIPNYANIGEEFKNKDYDPENKFSVPYTWGTVGVIYNTKYVAPVDSWSALWDENYSGKILMFGNSRDAFMVSSLLLGYDINTTDHAEIEATAEKLREQKPLVQQYVMDQCYQQMIDEEAWLVPYYAGDFLQMQRDNEDLAFAFPKEGYNLYIDAMCIPTCAENKAGAEAYINFMCDPEISGANMDWVCYSSPVTGATEYMDPEMAESDIAYPSAEILALGKSYTNLPTDTVNEVNALWNEISSSGSGLNWIVYAAAGAVVVVIGVVIAVRKKKRNQY